MPVIVEASGFDRLTARLEGMASRTALPQPIFEVIMEDMRRVERATFSGQGRRGGGSWAFLQDDTLMRKDSPLILVDTGALLASLSEAEAEYSVAHMTNNIIYFGTDRPGARAQQFGDPKHNLPARPFLDFTLFDLRRWGKMLGDYIII